MNIKSIVETQDISEQKKIEASLRESEERLNFVLEGSQLGFWDWNIETGEVKRNERWAEMLGFRLIEILNSDDLWTDLIHPDDRMAAWTSIQEHLEGHTTKHEIEYRMRTKEGSYKWILDHARIVKRDDHGRPLRMSGTHTDITERKLSEEALKKSAEEYRNLVNNIPGMVYQARPDWSAEILSNSEEVCGYSREDFQSKRINWSDIIHIDDKARVLEEGQLLAEKPCSIVQEYRVVAKDGSIQVVSDRKSSSFTEDGKFMRIDGVVYNISEHKKADNELKESEARFRALFEQAAVGVAQIETKTGRFVSVNQRYCDILGYSIEEMTKLSFHAISHPDDLRENLEKVELMLEGAIREFSLEKRYIRKNGSIIWVNLTVSPMWAPLEKPDYHIAVVEDITHRKQSEEELRKFSRAVEQTVSSVMITDTNGVIEYVNPTFTRISGYSVDEVIGKRPSISKSGKTSQEEYKNLWQTIKSGGEWQGEFHNRRKDGQEYWVSASISPIRRSDGVITHFLAIQEDITERKLIEAALHQQNEYLSALHEISLGILSHHNLDDLLQSLIQRAGQLLNTPHGCIYIENKYKNALECRCGTGMLTQDQGLQFEPGEGLAGKVWQTGRPLLIEDYQDWDGRSPQFPDKNIRSVFGFPLLSGSQTIGVLVLVKDLDSDRLFNENDIEMLVRLAQLASISIVNAQLFAEAQEERSAAERANAAKSIFLSSISHELRTPLNAILGFTQLMRQSGKLSSEQQEYIEIINRSGVNLLNLINDVLEFSKIESGRVTLHEKSFNLENMLDSIEEMSILRAREKGLLLNFERANDIPRYIHTDEVKLSHALTNLVINAIKFTQIGEVTLRVRSSSQTKNYAILHFEVEDTGPGISPEDQAIIFNPFMQAANGHQIQEGTGLGLAISRQYVRLLGGDISVTSKLGQGSLFQFELTIRTSDIVEMPIDKYQRRVIGIEADQRIIDGNPYRLLIAEDEDMNRLLLVQLLKPLGFEIKEAVNGQEAIDIWNNWKPDLIWMDMQMPVLNGYIATRQIKAAPTGRSTIIIALTAAPFEEDREKVLFEGCDDFLRKPIKIEQIYKLLSKHLGVRFTYEELVPQSDNIPQGTATGTGLSPGTLDLSGVSEGLLEDLHNATVLADINRILHVIDQIRIQNPAVALELTKLARKYEYRKILALVDRVGDAHE